MRADIRPGDRRCRRNSRPISARALVLPDVLIALAVFIALALQKPDASSGVWALEDAHEIETPLEETSSFSFRSEAAAMTVVWVDSHRE